MFSLNAALQVLWQEFHTGLADFGASFCGLPKAGSAAAEVRDER
ncbi:hypothetical protein [Pseudomonas cavernae]|nr:hypothetical protein [Pseudomonas cavernae]